MKIDVDGKEVELLKDVPEYYCYISELSNQLLDNARSGIKTWVSKDVLDKMNVSIWVYADERVNAFAKQQDGNNYIASDSITLLELDDEEELEKIKRKGWKVMEKKPFLE